MNTRHLALVALLALTACPRPPDSEPWPSSGFTDGQTPPPPVTTGPDEPPPPPPILVCPGETQCPCEPALADDSGGPQPAPCALGQMCGPTGACTQTCVLSTDCRSGVSGENCIATGANKDTGLCGVPCDPGVVDGGCSQAGMPGATCITLGPGDHYCGYR